MGISDGIYAGKRKKFLTELEKFENEFKTAYINKNVLKSYKQCFEQFKSLLNTEVDAREVRSGEKKSESFPYLKTGLLRVNEILATFPNPNIKDGYFCINEKAFRKSIDGLANLCEAVRKLNFKPTTFGALLDNKAIKQCFGRISAELIIAKEKIIARVIQANGQCMGKRMSHGPNPTEKNVSVCERYMNILNHLTKVFIEYENEKSKIGEGALLCGGVIDERIKNIVFCVNECKKEFNEAKKLENTEGSGNLIACNKRFLGDLNQLIVKLSREGINMGQDFLYWLDGLSKLLPQVSEELNKKELNGKKSIQKIISDMAENVIKTSKTHEDFSIGVLNYLDDILKKETDYKFSNDVHSKILNCKYVVLNFSNFLQNRLETITGEHCKTRAQNILTAFDGLQKSLGDNSGSWCKALKLKLAHFPKDRERENALLSLSAEDFLEKYTPYSEINTFIRKDLESVINLIGEKTKLEANELKEKFKNEHKPECDKIFKSINNGIKVYDTNTSLIENYLSQNQHSRKTCYELLYIIYSNIELKKKHKERFKQFDGFSDGINKIQSWVKNFMELCDKLKKK